MRTAYALALAAGLAGCSAEARPPAYSPISANSGTGALPDWTAIPCPTYAGMSLVNSFITGVSEGSSTGDCTYTLDYTATVSTTTNNVDLFYFDPITAWATAGSRSHALQFRIDVLAEPDSRIGEPYMALFAKNGVTGVRTGNAAIWLLRWDADGRDYFNLFNSLTGVQSATSGTSWTGESFQSHVVTWLLEDSTSTQTRSYSETVGGGSFRVDIRDTLSASIPGFDEIDAGYNTASGAHFAIGFQQLVGTTGTGSVRIQAYYRILDLIGE